MDEFDNSAPEASFIADLGKDIIKSVILSVATTAASVTVMVGVGYAVTKMKERKAAKAVANANETPSK